MFKIFKRKTTSQKILDLSDQISELIEGNSELKSKIDQVGIIDGNQVVSEFIDNNENRLAYKHLIYMIQESGIHLETEQMREILNVANKVEGNEPDFFLPTVIEIEEFYRLLHDFNQIQQKVVAYLTKIWNMEIPMTGDKWIVWSQEQYERDEFKNEERLIIFPHGFGLSYEDSDDYIDFDFGEHGEINGFDVNRLWWFIETSEKRTLFTNEAQIKKVVDFETNAGNLVFSGYINYYKK